MWSWQQYPESRAVMVIRWINSHAIPVTARLLCGLPGCHLHVWHGLLHLSPACLGVVSLICHHCAWAWPAWPFLVSVWTLQCQTSALPVNSGCPYPVLGCFQMGSTLEGQDWEVRLAGRGPGRSSDLHTLGLPPGEGRWLMGRGPQSRGAQVWCRRGLGCPTSPLPFPGGTQRGLCVCLCTAPAAPWGPRESKALSPATQVPRPPALPWSLSITSLPGVTL